VISRAFLFLLHNLIINIKKYFFPGALTFEVRIAVWRRMPSYIYIYVYIYIYIYCAECVLSGGSCSEHGHDYGQVGLF
jgi:hypothetical protein